MKFGDFDRKTNEYVINRPDTPLPWINYLGADQYCALMSNTAGGYSFYRDPLLRRLTRYRYNNVPSDRGGRYLYIRDNKTEDFWSATWQPILKDLKKYKYECRVGTGYTAISSEYANIKTKATYFVPLGENLEVWMLEVTNKGKTKRDLSAFSFVEFCLWDALNDMTDYQYNLNIGETDYANNTIFHLARYRIEHDIFGFFGVSNAKVDAFDSDRDYFMGPYGDFSDPKSVREGQLTNSIACGWSPVGSHQINMELKPGETKTIIFVLGVEWDRKVVKEKLTKYNSPEKVNKALQALKDYWAESLSKFSCRTEDEDLNLMFNLWNQYQCRTTFNWSRSASYYESGIGRGMGYRDSNQDTLGFVHLIPEKVRERITDIASTQFEVGNANHQYQPLTKKGAGGGFSDDHLWLIQAVASYVKETGDVDFLNAMVPYESGKKATMYEHCAKAIEFSMNNLGPHGLPLMFNADWNDCLNLPSPNRKAESVMVAEQLVWMAREMQAIAQVAGKKDDVIKYLDVANKIKAATNKVAWDGEWYVRGFDDSEKPVGSKINNEGKIYLESQVFGVLSGVAEGERAIQTMDSVKKHLASKYGIMLLQPSYTEFVPAYGGISIYPPGLKENGAIFCHPNPWAMISECMLGRGDQAYTYYRALLPAAQNDTAEVRRVEPYVYCQMIAGRDHKKFGEGKNSWLTGSACWNFVAVSQWILGIRPDHNGLIVDPCIPKKWNGFEAKRVFRGDTYFISVRNPKHVSKGVKEIVLDGKRVSSNIIPVVGDGKEHHVEITLG